MWRARLAALRSIPILAVDLTDSLSSHRITKLMHGRLRGVLANARPTTALVLPETFGDYLSARRKDGAIRKSLRQGRNLGLDAQVVNDVHEQRRNLHELLVGRGWPGDPVAMLTDQHDLRPGRDVHLVCTDADGGVLAVAILLISGSTAMLGFSMATNDRSLSSIARYRVSALMVETAISLGATVLIGDSVLTMPSGHRQFSRAIGFSPYRILVRHA